MAKPKWIAVTGLYGTGKTSLVDYLEKWYVNQGQNVKRLVFPLHRPEIQKQLANSSDIQFNRLLVACYTRSVINQIKEFIESSEFDVIITEGSILDLLYYSNMFGYYYSNSETLVELKSLITEDIVIMLDGEYDIIYPRIHNPEGMKEKNSLKRISKQIKRLYDFLMKQGINGYENTKIEFLDTTVNSTGHTFKAVKCLIDG